MGPLLYAFWLSPVIVSKDISVGSKHSGQQEYHGNGITQIPNWNFIDISVLNYLSISKHLIESSQITTNNEKKKKNYYSTYNKKWPGIGWNEQI